MKLKPVSLLNFEHCVLPEEFAEVLFFVQYRMNLLLLFINQHSHYLHSPLSCVLLSYVHYVSVYFVKLMAISSCTSTMGTLSTEELNHFRSTYMLSNTLSTLYSSRTTPTTVNNTYRAPPLTSREHEINSTKYFIVQKYFPSQQVQAWNQTTHS